MLNLFFTPLVGIDPKILHLLYRHNHKGAFSKISILFNFHFHLKSFNSLRYPAKKHR